MGLVLAILSFTPLFFLKETLKPQSESTSEDSKLAKN
jgi:hypothetical protein